MQKVQLSKNVTISRLVHGLWRLPDWNLSTSALGNLIHECIDVGITTFDHADIYGNHSCETIFGEALAQNSISRNQIQLISKCGIQLVSDKFPNRKTKHYDYSAAHIINSVENSLQNLRTDYLDVLLLHRPSPFFNPEEVAKAFDILKTQGKVLDFGVSNFSPAQFKMLQSYVSSPLVTNQVEISPLCLDEFQNGGMELCLENRIPPMAWSPLAGGSIFHPKNANEKRVHACLQQVAKELDEQDLDKIAYAWLLKHPANCIPIIGSGKIARIQKAVASLELKLSLEQWFSIYTAASGNEVP